MNHFRDLAGHEIEELLEEMWTLEEQGRLLRAEIVSGSKLDGAERVLELAERQGLVRFEGRQASFTGSGRELASRQIRRHRLAEFLFSEVLEVKDEGQVNRTACVMEHILSPEVTDSVCSFLGHPKSCPHGKPIPAGDCCRSFSMVVEPLVQPLDRLAVGSSARIVYIAAKQPRLLAKLSGLGLAPAVTVQLKQKTPATVIGCGETTLALDPEIGAQIWVRRL